MKILAALIPFLFASMTALGQADISMVKGNQYYRQAQYELAEAQYRKALEADPKSTTAQYNLANALQMQKKFNEAIPVLDALAAATNNRELKSAAYYNQGVAHTKLKNLEGSIESYKNALRLNPSDQQARENLEKALLELKKKQQQQNQNKKQEPKMSEKEAEQKLQLLQQKEKELQQRKQNNQQGAGQAQDW